MKKKLHLRVNFLSHYYFDQDQSPEFIVGISIPDIAGNFSNHYNQFFKSIDSNSFESKEKAIMDGIKKHYLVDAIFHDAPLFDYYCKTLKTRIQQNPWQYKLPRLFFVVHVLFELILDAYLIHSDSTIVNRYYYSIKKVENHTIASVFSYYKKMGLEISHIIANFIRFSSHEFLRLYEVDANLVTGLKHICKKQLIPS